jgi:hypothetical protein
MTLEKASCRESAELDRQRDPASRIRDMRVTALEKSRGQLVEYIKLGLTACDGVCFYDVHQLF